MFARGFQKVVIGLGVLFLGTLAFGSESEDRPRDLLDQIGLEGMEIISQEQAALVRGLGVGSSGTSILIGALIDPSTGSTANFFQIQSSGATGAKASHSNMINASFEWNIGGIIQRFQAEIGGFGASFAR